MMRHGSTSSEGSLTFSDTSTVSSESRYVRTPPDTPRDNGFQFADSPVSIETDPSESDEICYDMSDEAALDAFQRLDLHVNPFISPTQDTRSATISKWAAQLTQQSPSSPVSPPGSMTSPNKLNRKPALKMDFSNIPSFALSSHSPDSNVNPLLNAPLIGCLPSPSPTTMKFSPVTPRPPLVSRFSDESSSSSSNSPSADGSPFESRSNGMLASPPNLKVQNVAQSGLGPMTPRTVDALDCFGISSSLSSNLMTRGRSKDKLASSPGSLFGRSLPRSPLAMPPSNFVGQTATSAGMSLSPSRTRLFRSSSASNPYFLSAQ